MATDGFMLYSDICIYLIKDSSPQLSRRTREQLEGSLFVSAISLAEIGLGVRDRPGERSALARFERDVAIVPFDAAAAACYATLPFRRARFDRLIAAHALVLGLTLVTNNVQDFIDVPGLIVENWTQ